MITVNGNGVEWKKGMTVEEVLRSMKYTAHLILVKVDGMVVPQEDFRTALVPDGAVVEAIHLIGGG